jgi:LysM repeat protein
MRKVSGFAMITVAVLILSLLAVLVTYSDASGETAFAYKEYRVKSGDTLWAIAKAHVGDSGDVREYIYDIMKHNGMKSPDLRPGQVLNIPVGY